MLLMLKESIHHSQVIPQWKESSIHSQLQWFLLKESIQNHRCESPSLDSLQMVLLLLESMLSLSKQVLWESARVLGLLEHDSCKACRLHSLRHTTQRTLHMSCCCREHCRVCHREFFLPSHFYLFVHNNTIVQPSRPSSLFHQRHMEVVDIQQGKFLLLLD